MIGLEIRNDPSNHKYCKLVQATLRRPTVQTVAYLRCQKLIVIIATNSSLKCQPSPPPNPWGARGRGGEG